MSLTIMLGGVPIVAHAGAPEQTEEAIGGSTVLRMSDGAAVKMQHWQKTGGTITGAGLMPPGLDGLDFSQPLELRTMQVSNIVGPGPTFTLTSTPRPDQAPWAHAFLDGRWVRTPCATHDGVVTVTQVTGATHYQVSWLPVYSVFASKPSKAQSSSHTWSIPWEEA